MSLSWCTSGVLVWKACWMPMCRMTWKSCLFSVQVVASDKTQNILTAWETEKCGLRNRRVWGSPVLCNDVRRLTSLESGDGPWLSWSGQGVEPTESRQSAASQWHSDVCVARSIKHDSVTWHSQTFCPHQETLKHWYASTSFLCSQLH